MVRKIKVPVYINVSNFHLAKVTEGTDLSYVAGVPDHIIGLMKLKQKTELSEGKLYGDGIIRVNVAKKTGYLVEIESNAIPPDWRAYMEGASFESGKMEGSGPDDVPGLFALGVMKERDDGSKEMIWYPYCQAQPIESEAEQSGDKTNFSTPKLTILVMSQEQVKKYYKICDTLREEFKDITPELFFSKVQIGDVPEQAEDSPGVGG